MTSVRGPIPIGKKLLMTEGRAMAIIPPPENESRSSGKGGRKMRPLICLAQVVLALSCTLQGCGKLAEDRSTARDPLVGKPAPIIDGVDLDGKALKLSDFRGKVVLLSFYASWCVPCVRQFPHEIELVKAYHDQPFALIGINGDTSPQVAKDTTLKHGLTWRSVWDGYQGGNLARRYQLQGWPTFLLVDGKGIIRNRWCPAPEGREVEVAINGLLREIEEKQ
jgi:thiol-disulfide isomerase/thioredoxin